jgi:hypothetical protein
MEDDELCEIVNNTIDQVVHNLNVLLKTQISDLIRDWLKKRIEEENNINRIHKNIFLKLDEIDSSSDVSE